jgi:RND superfamily putative drug exporter
VNKQTTTVRLARWSATHPWRAIVMWIVFVAVCFAAGGAAGTKGPTKHQLGVGESGRASDITALGGLDSPAAENVLITARSGTLNQAAARQAATETATKMRPLTDVEKVAPPVTSPDGKALVVVVTMRGDPDTADTRVQPLLDITAAVQHDHPDLRVEQVGDASMSKGVNDILAKDFGKATSVSLPITLLILVIAFGAIIAAGVPVILALCAVMAAIGLSSLVSHVIPATDTINEVILLVGMAVGVDYSLFYLKREREERAKGRGRIDAIEVAAATSGHAVMVSGLAVMVSMAGLYLANDVTFASLATGSIIVVAVAMLGSLTVLPALLAKLGRAVDRPRIPFLWRLTNRPEREPRLWPALLRPALRRPGITLVLALAGLLLLAQPALTMKLHTTGAGDLPRAIPAMQSYDRLTTAFPSKFTTHVIAVQAPSQRADQVTAALTDVVHQTEADPLFVSQAQGQTADIRASADGRVHTLEVEIAYPSNSKEAARSLERLRSDLVPTALNKVQGARYAVGGEVAGNTDYAEHAQNTLPFVMGFVLLLTLVIMTVTFRSIVIALTAIVVNLLSACAAFGILVIVFQRSWAEKLLDFHSNGGVVSWMPMFLFVVLFGLSMDYHVFVVSRIREGVESGLSTKEAVRQGITRSAGVVTSAAIVMVSVFAIFATLSMVEFKQLGVGLSAAVLLDALVVRIVLLPSLMALLGRWNWWPGKLSRKPKWQRLAEDDRQPALIGRR